ncbi:MAG: ATP-dependent helicase, partial [Frankiaceae bacterium]|nr:ATP-dependent helicase [Frankiaceae bacterium]
SDHLATAEDVRRHDERCRDEIAALSKVLAKAKELEAKTRSREELLTLVAAYRAEKQRLDVIDFGDQVALACEIVQTSPEVVAAERARFSLVVLDEYQDTGVAQRVLLSRLFGGGHSITAVGDPNQAIYGWRGASASNLSRFGEHFAGGIDDIAPLPLMTSFRCAGRILDAANQVASPLSQSLERKGRSRVDIPALRPTKANEGCGEVIATRLATAPDEAEWLAGKIIAAMAEGTKPKQIAVLSRRRADFPRLHHAMVERGIPVEVVGLGGLLAMPEVSDIVAVLSLLADGTANAAAVRLLSGPRWRLGVRDLAALGERAAFLARERPEDPDQVEEPAGEIEAQPAADEPAVSGRLRKVLQEATSSVDPVEVPSLLEAAESPGRQSRCSSEARDRLGRFAAEMRQLRGLVGQPLVDLITEVIRTTGLDVEIEAGDASLAEARMANVHAFLDVAAAFTGLDGEADLSAFLAYLKAADDNEDGLDIGSVSEANTVKLLTIHAAKGLEWDVVAVPGLVDSIFPTVKSRSSWITGAQVLPFECRGDAEDLPVLKGYGNTDIEEFRDLCRSDSHDEERRLAYVAVTRAAKTLWLSSYLWGPTRQNFYAVSPFLKEVVELGDEVVTLEEWVADPEEDAINLLLEAGVADVPWPAMPEPAEMSRRRSVAATVEDARGRLDLDTGLSGAAAETAASWQRDTDLLIDEIRRRRTRTIDVAVPTRLTTSQVVAMAADPDAFAASVARPMPARPVAQARRGSRFHQWVENLYGVSPLLEPDDLPGAEDADLDDTELASLQQTFLATGWGERRPVRVEAPFEMVIGGRLLRGRIDAVYPTEEGGYDVIDFKTGAVLTGKDFEAASHQLSIYRLAWADLAGVDPASVTAGFLYVRDGVVKRPERLLNRDELAALVSQA